MTEIRARINGKEVRAQVEPRTLASDFLRHTVGTKGVHVGCEHGVCGACTIVLDGTTARSCLLFAVQLDGAEVMTVEGLAARDGALHPIQAAFRECHALQCGFCTPGFLMSVYAFLNEEKRAELDEAEIRSAISGNLCRCTGYKNIVQAVQRAARSLYGGA
ncbi:MAG: (2Fe-2S)-binding protein [Candidatus Binatia bacterium]